MTDETPRTIIDLSHPLGPDTPAFPGDPSPEIRIFDSTEDATPSDQRHLNCSHLSTSLHCGTHMDAPFHFFGDRTTIDRVPLERTVGKSLLIRLPWEQLAGNLIDAEHLLPFENRLRAIPRVVFNTLWHHRWGAKNYFTEHPLITGAAARLLVDCGVQLVGVDTPSVDRPPFEAHLELLGNDVLIVENLTNLDAVPGDTFDLIATPLAILGRDGSPVRAIAIV
jgi:arylformamidase